MNDELPLVLVTGASGFVASHVVAGLVAEQKYRVRGTVRSSTSETSKLLKETFPDVELVEADLSKDDGWKECVFNVRDLLFLSRSCRSQSGGRLRVRSSRRLAYYHARRRARSGKNDSTSCRGNRTRFRSVRRRWNGEASRPDRHEFGHIM